MDFKDKLKNLRTKAGLSQEALADIIHVSRSAIAKYENGGGKPSKEILRVIANYFKVDISYLEDDGEKKNTKRTKVGLVITIVSGAIFFIGTIVTIVFYSKLKFTVSSAESLKLFILLLIIIISLVLFGVALLVGYLLAIIKTSKKRLVPTLIFIAPIAASFLIGVSGVIAAKVQYNDFKTFTSEKWINASNNHYYRGLLVYSFLEQYDIRGNSIQKVKNLLGTPDQIREITLYSEPPQYGGVIYIYDLGYYKNYMDPTTFEITFNQTNNVVSYNVFTH